MIPNTFFDFIQEKWTLIQASVYTTTFLIQVLLIAVIYALAFILARQVRRPFKFTREAPQSGAHTIHNMLFKLGGTLFPVITISILKLTTVLGEQFQFDAWVLEIAVVVAVMLFVASLIRGFIDNPVFAGFMRWVGLPILFLH